MVTLQKKTAHANDPLISNEIKDKNSIASLIKQWGGSASSTTLLDPDCKIFSTANIEGIIGYRTELDTAIAFGDPVCSPSSKTELAKAFHEYCRQQGKNVVYITASEEFSKWAISTVCKGMIEVGEELILDPNCYPKDGHNGRLLRKKMNHSHNAGVVVEEYRKDDIHLKNEIEQVGTSWLKARHGPQIYLAHVHLFNEYLGKRWFYAKQKDKIIGVLSLNQLEARQGWVLNMLMTTPDAPGGTSELLVISALETFCREGCHFLTFGATPSEQLGEIIGLGKISTSLARTIFKMTKKIFHLDGRRKYWKKFEPESERSYLLFSKPRIGFKDAVAIMRALNVGF